MAESDPSSPPAQVSSASYAPDLFRLDGRVALVTGGAGLLGGRYGEALVQAGARVVVGDLDAQRANALATELNALDVRASPHQRAVGLHLDVADPGSVRACVAASVDAFGRLDILVNNAGMSIRKPPEAYTAAEWGAVLETNLTGAFVCSQAAHPVMRHSGGGKIINIGSMFALFGSAYAAPYAASKGALVQLTKSLATAWAADNIQVNAVLPGWIDTELTQDARRQVAGLHERVLARTPAGRWGVPQDLAGIAVFLASSASDFITGAAIPVDGGFSAMG
jgi:2-deoxy-D-gluconate 3-dehydrogenase